MGKRGPKVREIEKDIFEELCKIQCTEAEICAVLSVSPDTLIKWCKRTYGKTFEEVAKEMRAVGCSNLRRFQFKQAERNTTMAIWLGKQYLGQTEKVQTTLDTTGGGLKIEVVHDVPDEGTASAVPSNSGVEPTPSEGGE